MTGIFLNFLDGSYMRHMEKIEKKVAVMSRQERGSTYLTILNQTIGITLDWLILSIFLLFCFILQPFFHRLHGQTEWSWTQQRNKRKTVAHITCKRWQDFWNIMAPNRCNILRRIQQTVTIRELKFLPTKWRFLGKFEPVEWLEYLIQKDLSSETSLSLVEY